MAIDDSGNIYTTYFRGRAGGTNIYVAYSSDQGNTWAKFYFPKSEAYGGPVDIAVDHQGTVWLLWISEDSGDFAPIYVNLSKSTDTARTFITVFHSLSYSDGYLNQKLAVDGANNIFMLWDDQRFKLTKFEHGDTANRVDAELPANGLGVGSHPALVITKDFIIHCAWEGFYYDSLNNLFYYTFYSRSIDTGATFQGKTRVDTTGEQGVPSLAVDSLGKIFVSYQGSSPARTPQISVSKSANGGQSFDQPVLISGADSVYSGSPMCIDSQNGINIIWSAQYKGQYHYRSTDGGITFAEFTSLPRLGVSDFKAVPHNNLYILGDSDITLGISRTNVLLSVSENNNIPNTFALSQNYPNPFNSSTIIRFSVGKTAMIDLRVFDMLGREVGNLVSERLAPGVYSTRWDAINVSSGVYFVRLVGRGTNEAIMKMILMK